MKLISQFKAYLTSDRGALAVEFPLIFFFMFSVSMFAFQVAFAMFEMISDDKAAQSAARLAAVRAPVHSGVPKRNPYASSDVVGQPCGGGKDNCGSPGGPWTCTPGNWDPKCDTSKFLDIYNDLMRQGINVKPEEIAISYSYSGLGFADGPFIPLIKVALAEKPFTLSFGFLGNKLVRPEIIGYAVGEDMKTSYP